jgi:hypothetical protein
MATAIISCSENEEDIAAPSINIIQPHENDTIYLVNGCVYVKVEARDNLEILDMEMELEDQSGTISKSYDNDDINNQSYSCNEKFELTGITSKTKMTLKVTFENEFWNWKSKTIIFYVKP